MTETEKILRAPADGRVLGEIVRHHREDLFQAVRRAREVQPAWDALPRSRKTECAERAARWIHRNAHRIAETVAACTGKTRVDALSTEVLPGATAWVYYARLAGKALRPRTLRRSSVLFLNKKSSLRREPYGVVGIISPWNYPFAIPLHETATGLLAGNGVVLKVATQVQPVGELIAEMIDDAGFPPGIFGLIHLPGPEAGPAFVESGIGKLFFTGSTETGKTLAGLAARRLLPVSLELGGKDAMIVLRDANLSRAAAGAVWAGVSNCGQSCAGVERIYVEKPVYDRFLRLLRARVSVLRQGPDGDWDADFGGLTTAEQKETVAAQLEDALRRGAVVTASSPEPAADPGGGLYHPALVVETDGYRGDLMSRETFGPILAVSPVEDAEEALRRANDSPYGLTASIWTADSRRARELASRLEVGVVTLNDHLMSHGMAETPWGGFKESGIGRSHGLSGFHEMTREKVVVTERLPMMKRNMWWHPHSRRVYDGLMGALDMLFAAGPVGRIRGAFRAARLFGERFFRS